ncbi:caspase family protein [bacterium]|nr:caspase family protein [bacterium]
MSLELVNFSEKLEKLGSKADIKIFNVSTAYDMERSDNIREFQPNVRLLISINLKSSLDSKNFEVIAKTRKVFQEMDLPGFQLAIEKEKDYIADCLVEGAIKALDDNISLLPYQRLIAEDNSNSNNATPSATSGPIASTTPSSIRDKWALIVGISNFQDKRIPKLKYSAKDARDFRDFLVNECNFAPDHVRLLLNEKATERRVTSELGNKFLARVAKTGDLTVLYFSTHGSSSKADIKGKNYLVAYDTDRDDLYATGIEMQKISDAISDRIDSGRVLLVLDACHSGATTGGAKAMNDPGNFDAEEIAQGSGKLVMCSSKPDQQSWESARYQNGVFTRKLIEGLKINGKKTKLADAFNFVTSSVKAEVQEDQAIKQEPVLRSKWDGSDLILAIPPTVPQALPQAVKHILEPDSSAAVVSPVSKSTFPAKTIKKK